MKSLSKACLAALLVASPLVAPSAFAQAPTPAPPPVSLGSQPPPVKSDAPLPKLIVDCGLTSLQISAQVHRTAAIVDVSFRVKAVKGGTCVIHPEVQITTAHFANAGRFVAETFVDGTLLQPVAISDNPNPEKLFTGWTGSLAAGEERKVDFRFYVEGETVNDKDAEPPALVSVESRNLGPRMLDKAPVTAVASFEPGIKASGALGMGVRGVSAEVQPAAADGTVRLTTTYSDRDRSPTFGFHYEAPPPAAATPNGLSGGLRVIEYLRDGLVRDLMAASADAKNEKAVNAAWDQAFDVAFAASQSKDPIVAGIGVRSLVFLGGGLSPTATVLKASGAAGDGIVAPDSVLKATAGVAAAFTAATGQNYAPSPANSHSLRSVLLHMGDPVPRKKLAEDAFKRLGKRVEANKVAITVGTVFDVLPVPTPGPGVDPATAQPISFDRRRPMVATAGAAAPKSPAASRFVRAFTHRRPSRGFLVFLLVIFAAGFAGFFGWKARSAAPEQA